MVELLLRRPFAAAALAAALLAPILCPPPARAAPQVEIQDDNFSPSATFIGPAQSINPFGGTYRLWRLRSWVNKANGRVDHQLYVDTNYMWGRRGWAYANDDNAGEHRVVQIAHSASNCRGRDKAGCVYYETIGVDLDDAFVRRRADGFQIKLTARSGDELILDVNAAQIAPVLEAIDAYQQHAGVIAPAVESSKGLRNGRAKP